MALFENFERREAKILAVLKEYGISVNATNDITINEVVIHLINFMKPPRTGYNMFFI